MLNISELKGYVLKEHRKIDELHGEGYVLEHRKSGARVLLIDNDDNNKVFSIAFGRRRRTIPVWRTFWSTPCSAVRRSSHLKIRLWSWPRARSIHF